MTLNLIEALKHQYMAQNTPTTGKYISYCSFFLLFSPKFGKSIFSFFFMFKQLSVLCRFVWHYVYFMLRATQANYFFMIDHKVVFDSMSVAGFMFVLGNMFVLRSSWPLQAMSVFSTACFCPRATT